MKKNRFSKCLVIGCLLVCLASFAKDVENLVKKKKVLELYDVYQGQFATIPDVSPIKASEQVKNKAAIIIDARDEEERKISHIPESISQKQFETSKELYKNKIIVVYCTIGYRSGVFVKKLRKEGLDARNLQGGILNWIFEGLPIFDNGGAPTKHIHVYGRKWNLTPADYIAQW